MATLYAVDEKVNFSISKEELVERLSDIERHVQILDLEFKHRLHEIGAIIHSVMKEISSLKIEIRVCMQKEQTASVLQSVSSNEDIFVLEH
jgi:hypothetical protein